jgi:hypothetical protein
LRREFPAEVSAIQSDIVMQPPPASRPVYVLDAGSGILTTFAGEYVHTHENGERLPSLRISWTN